MFLDRSFFRSVLSEVQFYNDNEVSQFNDFCVDSRLVKKGDLFICLTGNKLDGHDFIKDAVSNGASGLMISLSKKDCLNKISPEGLKEVLKKLSIIMVQEPQEALIKLARAWRSKFDYPVVGITGSIGKTSTKEILSSILKLNNNSFIVSHGNQNTSIGISLNILRMRPEHQMAIFEMGISKRGEMARIAELVRPTLAVITFIGHSHMEGLGSLSDIAAEKRDIFKYFKESNIGIINGDQEILTNISYNHPIVKFGYKTTNQVQARKIQTSSSETNFVFKLYKEKYKITLSTNHSGRVLNSLAAATVAYMLDVKSNVIVEGLQYKTDVSGRFEPIYLKNKNVTIINDCYNASPESMKAALLAFEKLKSQGQKIAILGDMLELGVNSPFWHRQLGRVVRKVSSLKHIILVGDMVKWTSKTLPMGLTYELVPDWKTAINSVQNHLANETLVLVKGSRGVGLNNLVDELKK